MAESFTTIVPIVLAIVAPLLKWAIDFVSESFGKRKIETIKTKIEVYDRASVLFDDEQSIEKLKASIRQDIENLSPTQKVKQIPYVSIPYSFIFYLVAISAIIMLLTNTIWVMWGVKQIYSAGAGSILGSILFLHFAGTPRKDIFKYFIPLAIVLFIFAYFINSIGTQLNSQGEVDAVA